MKLTKIGHSCILLEGKKNILIDPGNLIPDQSLVWLKDLDAILLTHEHADHTWPEHLHMLLKQNDAQIITNAGVGKVLDREGIQWSTEPGRLPIRIVSVPHGPLPENLPVPDHYGFEISGFLHPGDSITSDVQPRVLALPTIAPWMTLRDALSWAKKLRPDHILPIHDGFLKDPEFINRIITRAWPDAPIIRGPIEF